MLCVWWNWKSFINYELLPPNKTINLDLHYQQRMRLKQEIEKKQPELINRKAYSRGKREGEPAGNAWSPPPMNTCSPIGVIGLFRGNETHTHACTYELSRARRNIHTHTHQTSRNRSAETEKLMKVLSVSKEDRISGKGRNALKAALESGLEFTKEQAMDILGKLIKDLRGFADPKVNVHKPIKNQLASIEGVFEILQKLETQEQGERQKTSQRSPAREHHLLGRTM
ncbi:hypothetical protein EVAR_59132_1 [Eumeta japonica]|uniref:Uncharacterized protein n=1 Tax=Eumeta variegata TaxID=151549 RepID=A0A4C1ZCM5_EUMVA|nr:hypothetical protein EVAR_59132_1 [Eumeta japonica]